MNSTPPAGVEAGVVIRTPYEEAKGEVSMVAVVAEVVVEPQRRKSDYNARKRRRKRRKRLAEVVIAEWMKRR